jgi:hypothetical protein
LRQNKKKKKENIFHCNSNYNLKFKDKKMSKSHHIREALDAVYADRPNSQEPALFEQAFVSAGIDDYELTSRIYSGHSELGIDNAMSSAADIDKAMFVTGFKKNVGLIIKVPQSFYSSEPVALEVLASECKCDDASSQVMYPECKCDEVDMDKERAISRVTSRLRELKLRPVASHLTLGDGDDADVLEEEEDEVEVGNAEEESVEEDDYEVVAG